MLARVTGCGIGGKDIQKGRRVLHVPAHCQGLLGLVAPRAFPWWTRGKSTGNRYRPYPTKKPEMDSAPPRPREMQEPGQVLQDGPAFW